MELLIKIYYALSKWFYKYKYGTVGKKTELRFGNTVLNGRYVHLGNNCKFSSGFICAVYPEYANIRMPVTQSEENGVWIDDNVTANRNLTVYCAHRVHIQSGTMLGSNILITDNNHGTDAGVVYNYREQPLTTQPIEIGKDCWIGEKCSILSGAQIGDRCIVAANSVVKAGNYPAKSMLAGTPARIVRVWSDKSNSWVKPQRSETH